MDYGYDSPIIRTREGRKLEEIMFYEPVYKKGLQAVLRMRGMHLNDQQKSQSMYVRTQTLVPSKKWLRFVYVYVANYVFDSMRFLRRLVI
jgi:hypothetical protein